MNGDDNKKKREGELNCTEKQKTKRRENEKIMINWEEYMGR